MERLRGVSYDWRTDGRHDIGLIAEEVGKVMPEVVQYEENGVDAISLDYARLIPLLIEGIKEQQLQAQEKDAQIEALESRIPYADTLNPLTRTFSPGSGPLGLFRTFLVRGGPTIPSGTLSACDNTR